MPASFSKPTEIPRWADTGTVVVPSEAKKDSGWLTLEKPPASFFNWLHNRGGQWFKWLNERMFDGATADDFKIVAITGTTTSDAPGTLELRAGDAFNNAATTVAGGEASLNGGAGRGTGAGGAVNVMAGSALGSTGSGGTTQTSGGAGIGTDQLGGDAILRGGNSTGSGSSKSRLTAATAGASGTTARVSEDYFRADGAHGGMTMFKPFVAGTGIGSGVPTFEDRSATTALTRSVLRVQATSSGSMSDGFGGALDFLVRDASAIDNVVGRIYPWRFTTDDSASLLFQTASGGALSSNGLYIDRAGRVGVGAFASFTSLANGELPHAFVMAGNATPSVTSTLKLGDTALRWSEIYADKGRFTANLQVAATDLDLVTRHAQNAVLARANLWNELGGTLASSVTIAGDHWNVFSIVYGGTVGAWVISLDRAVDVNSTVIITDDPDFAVVTCGKMISTSQIRIQIRNYAGAISAWSADMYLQIALIGRPNVLP